MPRRVVRRATQIRSDRATPAPTVVRLDEDVVRLMRDELAEVADRAVVAITEEVPSYAGQFSGAMGETIRQAVQLALGGFLTLATREDAGTPMAPGARGRLPARPGRGPQRPEHGGPAGGVPDRRPRLVARPVPHGGGGRGRGRAAVPLRRAGLRLHRRALGLQRRRPHRRAREHRPGAAAQPRPAGPGPRDRRRRGRGGRRRRARRLGAAHRPERRAAAGVPGLARGDRPRPAHAATDRGGARRPRGTGPDPGSVDGHARGPRRAGAGAARHHRGDRPDGAVARGLPVARPRACAPLTLGDRGGRWTPTPTSARCCWPPTRRPAPTCAPACWPRWPTSGPRPPTSSPRPCAPGCCTRAAATPWPSSCSSTRRPCATASGSCASCTATGSRTRSSCSR